MRLRVVVVGRDRSGPLVEAAREFGERVRHYLELEVVELKETPLRKGRRPADVAADEADRIRSALDANARTIAFDGRGRPLTSLQWSERFGGWLESGTRTVQFVIGGPVGLDPSFVAAAHEVWSLGPLTLPHRLARVVVMEQTYRAFTILRGEPYHK